MKYDIAAQPIIDRLERASKTYGEVFDKQGIVDAMKRHYELLGVTMPEVVFIENMEDAYKARGAAWDAARGAAWDAARDAAWGAARGAAWDAAWGAAWGAARGAAWGAARDAAWDAAWGAARGAAWDAARGAARGAAWGAAALGSLPKDPACVKYAEIELAVLEALEKGLGFYFPMRDQLILVPVPKFKLNEQNLLHHDKLPAVQWQDKTGYYFLNGVRFPEDLFKKVTSGEMPFKDILQLPDIDQRTQAMRYGNVWDFIKHAKGEKLDEYTKFRLDGSELHYWLYKFPKGEIFTEDAYYAIYDDLVPDSPKQYMSGVIPCETVAEAMAWKFSNDEFTLTPDHWKRLVAGVNQN